MMLIAIIFLLTFNQLMAQIDYCAENMKCNLITNSGCDCKFGPNCEAPREHKVTEEIKKSLLVAHNKYREKVASGKETRGGIKGGATNMYALQYDEELEHTANCWNKKCTFAHDQCRITKKFRPVGQNLYWSSGKTCDWDYNLGQATYLWYEEINNMTPSCLRSYGTGCITSKVGYFSQMIWAQTTHIGCSLIEHAGPSCQIVCNYGPAGNFLDDEVYKSGLPGADCKFKSELYNSLCLLSGDQEKEFGYFRQGGENISHTHKPYMAPNVDEYEVKVRSNGSKIIQKNSQLLVLLIIMIVLFIKM